MALICSCILIRNNLINVDVCSRGDGYGRYPRLIVVNVKCDDTGGQVDDGVLCHLKAIHTSQKNATFLNLNISKMIWSNELSF